MNTQTTRINPFLADCIRQYRSRHTDEQIREIYRCRDLLDAFSRPERSWEEHLMAEALKEAMQDASGFLATLRARMDLPAKTIDGLYACRVDTVADLLQITEEEWDSLAQRFDLDMSAIKKYLQQNGYTLYRSAVPTFKIPAMDVLYQRNDSWTRWTLDALKESTFDIERPTLQHEWYKRYYRLHQYLCDEENLLSEYLSIKPECPDNELPLDYKEFFKTIREFWEHYEDFCQLHDLTPKFSAPQRLPQTPRDLESFSNDQFLMLAQNVDKAVIDILERTYFFKNSTPGTYLQGDDQERVDIVNDEKSVPGFQMLLFLHIELRINLDNLLLFMRKSK